MLSTKLILTSIITANDLTGLISDLRIDKTNTSLLVLFNAKNVTTAVTLSENVINKTELKINKINYKNLNDSINVILEFNF
jgi:hypothetical protein